MAEPGAMAERSPIDLGDEPAFDLGEMRVFPFELSVHVAGQQRRLQPRVMRVLVALAKAGPSVVSRDRLIEECWDGRVVGDDAINRCIFALRNLADDFDPRPFTIETVPRVGHRLLEQHRGGDAPRRMAHAPAILAATAGGAILVVLAVSLLLAGPSYFRWSLKPRVPRVLIVPAASDGSSVRLARDLAVELGSLTQVQPATMSLIGSTGDSRQTGDLILQVGRTAETTDAAANVAILAPAHGNILWSKEFREAPSSGLDLKQQIAFSTARVLGCAVDAMASRNGPTDEELKIYLSACSALANAGSDTQNIVPMLRQVLAKRPQFIGAWAKLLQAETQQEFGADEPPGNAARNTLQRDIAVARSQQPYLAEAYIAESALRPTTDFVGRSRILDEAVAHNPDHAEALVQRAAFLQSVGRINDAVDDARKAVMLDPLSPDARDTYVTLLATANRLDAARAELAKAERIWPRAEPVLMAQYRFELRFGDPREAQRLLRSGAIDVPGPDIQNAFIEARITPSQANVERAISMGRLTLRFYPLAIADHLQTLAQFGRKEELISILQNWHRMDLLDFIDGVLFRPAFSSLHHDPRFMKVASRLGLVNYWRATGEWPDFCLAPDLPYDCTKASGSGPASEPQSRPV